MFIKRLTLFAVSFLFPSLCPAQSVALLGGRPLEIPFQLFSGYLVVVEGSIGPLGHLKFILDTGTTRTCIDRRLARQLILPLEAESVFRFDNQVRLNSTHLASLTLGPLQAENFSVNVADLSHVGISHAPIDAIIGLDLLESFPFQIDYEQMRVTFGPIPYLAESAYMDAIPLLPVVSLDFNGFKSLLLIGTGAIKTVFFYEKLRGPSYGWRFLGTETWADSLGGITKARKVVFQGAAISPGRGFQEVYLIHAPPHDPLPMVNGILSPVAFGIRQIGFDFDRHIVTWMRSQGRYDDSVDGSYETSKDSDGVRRAEPQ